MRTLAAVGCVGGALLSYGAAQSMAAEMPAAPLQRVERGTLCVTNGIVSGLSGGRLSVETPSSRAVLRVASAQMAEIRFRYLGPSEGSKPLASGELRRQIGLKLRAQDTCNLVYVMWHIEPDSRVAVSVKRNPGKKTHQECGANGYVNVRARTSRSRPRIVAGETHTLRAELRGEDLTVLADGQLVWEGGVGHTIAEFDGPVGFRTDNARFILEYYASDLRPQSGTLGHGIEGTRCEASPGD